MLLIPIPFNELAPLNSEEEPPKPLRLAGSYTGIVGIATTREPMSGGMPPSKISSLNVSVFS